MATKLAQRRTGIMELTKDEQRLILAYRGMARDRKEDLIHNAEFICQRHPVNVIPVQRLEQKRTERKAKSNLRTGAKN